MPALAVRGHVFEKSFGEAGSGDGQLKEPSGVAVNEETGQLYVLDQGNSRIERFSSTGAYEAQFDGAETPAKSFAFAGVSLNDGIAVDNSCHLQKLSASECSATDPSNGDVYVTDPGNEVVDKFSPEGVYLGQLQEASGGAAFHFERLGGTSIDKNGTVWVYYTSFGKGLEVVGRFTNAEASTFISVRELQSHGFISPGFAVDSEDNFYALLNSGGEVESHAVSKFDTSGKALVEQVEEEETSGVAVELTNDDVYLDNFGTVGRFGASGSLIERLGLPGTKGSGVAADAASGSLYAADSLLDDIGLFVLESASPPTVESETISGVTGESATLEGEVNPRGAPTQYHFEYGRCATLSMCPATPYEESLPLPDASAGTDFEAHRESVHLQGLQAGAIYHFRVMARNELSATASVGEELTFTTQAAGGFVLPDGRQWEMVSPPDKHGASFQGLGLGQFLGLGVTQAAADGSAISYLAGSPTEAQAAGNSNGVQVLSMRGAGAWESRDISNPHDLATTLSVGLGSEYRFFSDDLSAAILQPLGDYVPLAQDASEQTPYLRSDYLNGDVGEPCSPTSMECYQPLVIGCPPAGEACASSVQEHANVPPGTIFGKTGGVGGQGVNPCPPALICGPQFMGASPDARHIVLASSVALTSTSIKGRGLYEWSGGELALVNVLPEGEGGGVTSSAALGFIGEDDAARDAVSDDGSHVFWSTRENGETRLYMRDVAKGETVRLDAGGENGSANAEFELASTSGSRAFFLDSQQLTGDSGAVGSKNDLYECEIVEAAGVPECRLSDITPLRSGENAADVQGVMGASRDASWVYFVANGVLAQGAVPGNCTGFSPRATCNLYVRHDGATTLVAVLSGEDAEDWGLQPGVQDFETSLTARVSPDGQWLAFMSQRKLTGYDNDDATSGKPDQEVYLYDSVNGKLVCASCNPSGGLPVGEQTEVGSLVAADQGKSLAAEIPGWTSFKLGEARYQSRYLSDSGRLFFNSYDSLVPQAVNGTWNVYEYEPPGVGDCSLSSFSFSERSSGCVGLISSGSSGEESAFLDASETGGDVFFLTGARLASQDSDSTPDIYDAHECTASSPCQAAAPIQPPACSTGDSCKSAPSPQPAIFGSPSSATFSGVGNVSPAGSRSVVKPRSLTRAQKLAQALKKCAKRDGHRKRLACQRKARRRFAGSRTPAKINARKKGRG
ncbi:MAG TPA: hypothetical protein VK781_06900 [Solirubrobacteraceae bacterium]|nr:hypothetical protein [Solirubrobacteraceae bacterium]